MPLYPWTFAGGAPPQLGPGLASTQPTTAPSPTAAPSPVDTFLQKLMTALGQDSGGPDVAPPMNFQNAPLTPFGFATASYNPLTAPLQQQQLADMYQQRAQYPQQLIAAQGRARQENIANLEKAYNYASQDEYRRAGLVPRLMTAQASMMRAQQALARGGKIRVLQERDSAGNPINASYVEDTDESGQPILRRIPMQGPGEGGSTISTLGTPRPDRGQVAYDAAGNAILVNPYLTPGPALSPAGGLAPLGFSKPVAPDEAKAEAALEAIGPALQRYGDTIKRLQTNHSITGRIGLNFLAKTEKRLTDETTGTGYVDPDVTTARSQARGIRLMIDSLKIGTGRGVATLYQKISEIVPDWQENPDAITGKIDELKAAVGDIMGTRERLRPALTPPSSSAVATPGALPPGIPPGSRRMRNTAGEIIYLTPDNRRLRYLP